MEVSETINLLQKKILKIFGFLILIRLGLYIPVPNVDLDIFSQNQVATRCNVSRCPQKLFV